MGRTICPNGHEYNSGLLVSCPYCKIDTAPVKGRLNRNEYFMAIAKLVAQRGTCPRAYVGAVVVNEKNRILGTGYNGSPPGHVHCLDVGCNTLIVDGKQYCIRTIHAEVNAVLTVGSNDANLILYSTHYPCFDCIKVLAAKGIRTVIYEEAYIDPRWGRMRSEYSQITFRCIR